MDCLTNRIGISGCGAPMSDAIEASGEGIEPVVEAAPALPILLVDDLPGISLENISAMVSNEQETFLGLWRQIVLRSMKKFEMSVKVKINECFKITDKAVIECLVCENKELFDVALWYLHACELMIERTSTDVLSRFTTIDLDKAEILKAEFYAEFKASLDDAVHSMNIKDSDCIEGDLEQNQDIQWVIQTP